MGKDESWNFLGHMPMSLAFLDEGALVVGDNQNNLFILQHPMQDTDGIREGSLLPSCNGFSGSSRFNLSQL